MVFVVEDAQGALSQSQGFCDCCTEISKADSASGNMENENIDIVLLEPLQSLEPGDLDPLVVDEKTGVALASGPVRDIGVESLPAPDHGGEKIEGALFQSGAD